MPRYACIILSLAVLAAGGCETLDTAPVAGGGTYSVPSSLPLDQEVKLGQEMAEQVESQMTVLDDAVIQAYVRDIGAHLAQFSPRKEITYRFTVIDEPDVVNAFALPGGHMYVFTGLMKAVDNEAELASVMAHEIAHVAGEHHGEMLSRQIGYERFANLVAGAILGENPGALAQWVAQVAGQVGGQAYQATYSRAAEAEADEMGLTIMWNAGYRPDAALTFMQKMIQIDAQEGVGRGGRLMAIFATHPPTQERMARLQSLLNRFPQQQRMSLALNQERYQQTVLSRLGK